VWNRIAPKVQDQIHEMALEQSELSPRELAVRFTDDKRYFVSEATVYRLLKAHDLITSPACVVIKAADQFHTKTTRPNEMWQTEFYLLENHRVRVNVPVDLAHCIHPSSNNHCSGWCKIVEYIRSDVKYAAR
jgi:hypothetical protein